MLLAVCANGLSGLLKKDEPQTALAIFPLNTDARVSVIASTLGNTSGPDLQSAANDIRKGLLFSSSDARLYSLMAEVGTREGQSPAAVFSYVDKARLLSKTEIYALEHTIQKRIADNDLIEAVSDIDTLLRRWPTRFETIADVFPQLLVTDEGYAAILSALTLDTPWRGRLFGSLGSNPDGILAADRLLLDLKATPVPPRRNELVAVINGHLKQKDYEAAYRLFLFTLDEEERKLGGLVFNGRFLPIETKLPFDWQIPTQPSAQVRFDHGPTSDSPESGATIRFLDKPLKGSSLRQFLQLPPGNYDLIMEASGRTLKLPKDLFWSLRCVDTPKEAARLPVSEGTYIKQKSSVSFAIQPRGCNYQSLSLDTALVAESFRHRYSGVLTINSIRIERSAV